MSFGKVLFCLSFLMLIFSVPVLRAQENSLSLKENKELLIGVFAEPPYVISGEDGTWDGISIRLWRAVADSLNLTYKFAEVDKTQPAVELLDRKFDVLLLGDVTSRAEAEIDFSHIYHISEMGVATSSTMDMARLASTFFNKRFWKIALALSVLLLIVGTIIYLVERNSNEDNFGGDRSIAKGIGSGFWWAGVTMTTIGYGDKAPVTFVGRALALIWMLIAMAVTAVLTASLVSVVMGSSGNKSIKAPDDLREMKIAAVEGSAASEYLKTERIQYTSFSRPSEALNSVNKQEHEAVLHTVPALRYHINNDPDLSLRVQTLKVDPHYYAFAVAKGSPLRKEINLGLLRFLNTALWQQEKDRFIPEKKK
ncbi:MAG: transporter substrate-binding domain-containing protein [Salinimicrobium sp.]